MFTPRRLERRRAVIDIESEVRSSKPKPNISLGRPPLKIASINDALTQDVRIQIMCRSVETSQIAIWKLILQVTGVRPFQTYTHAFTIHEVLSSC